jgi:hypothetical protein
LFIHKQLKMEIEVEGAKSGFTAHCSYIIHRLDISYYMRLLIYVYHYRGIQISFITSTKTRRANRDNFLSKYAIQAQKMLCLYIYYL